MTIDSLSARIPKDLIKQRQQDGQTLSYVEWTTVVQRLNEICQTDWSFKVTHYEDTCTGEALDKKSGEMVKTYEAQVWGALTVESVTRENMGFEDNSKFWRTPGQRYKSAVSDCIKRCAAMFGMGLELYHDLPETTMPDTIDPAQSETIIRLCSELAQLGESDKASQMIDYIDNTPDLTSGGAQKAIERLEGAIRQAQDKQPDPEKEGV